MQSTQPFAKCCSSCISQAPWKKECWCTALLRHDPWLRGKTLKQTIAHGARLRVGRKKKANTHKNNKMKKPVIHVVQAILEYVR